MEMSCEDVRRELAAGAHDAPLSHGARAHLAHCDPCGIALADAALAAAPAEPAAVEPPAKLLDLAIPLAAADARGLGWLFAGRWLGPRALGIVVVLAFAVLIRADAIVRAPLPMTYGLGETWRPVYGDLAEGMNTVVQLPDALPFLRKLVVQVEDHDFVLESLETPDAVVAEKFLQTIYAGAPIDRAHGFEEFRRLHAALPAGPARGPASRFLLQVLKNLDGEAPDLLLALHRDAKPTEPNLLAELVWIGEGLHQHLIPDEERVALCERGLLLRWRLVRTYGRKGRGNPVFADAHCNQHRGHANPRLTGATTELVGSLAAGHMLHAWNAGWPATIRALTDPEWFVPNAIWLFRSTIPGLAGCAAFLALWVLALAIRRRAALGAALAHAPDRGASQLLALALALSPCLAAVAVAGGLFWVGCAFVFQTIDFPLMGERHLFPPAEFLLDLIYDSELQGMPSRGDAAFHLALWFIAAGVLARLHLAALRWLDPAAPLRFRDVLVPVGTVILLALPPAPFRPVAIAQPVILGVAMILAMRVLRSLGSASERRLAAWTATAAVVLVLTNTGATKASHHYVYPLLSGAVAALVILLPATTGYVLAHMPAGTWRAQRLLAAAAVVFTPLVFASISARGTLAQELESAGLVSWWRVAATVAALFAMAAASLALGARLAPAGAAAFRDPSPSGWISRLIARNELDRFAIALWLILGWLVGHFGVLALHLNLI
jgi:hypothetical protein